MAQSVVRNAKYRRGGLSIRQRHNERQNMDYMNDDIVKDRAAYNVHFKQATGSYEQMFDGMVADGAISTRGLQKDAFIVDELVFDVNTAYFESGGGYDYAVSFFEEAYRCAVNEIGGEEYVLSAVMHADERNKAVSEQLGRDVYHYHLHVVYVPVVDKEIYFKKNNKDPEKAGKLREVIKQVSHSKKWPKLKQLDELGEVVRNEKGKPILVNSYSILQDSYHDHMTQAGFIGFERGERGSTKEHLTVLEFKAQQEAERAAAEAERAAAAIAVAEQKQTAAAVLDTAIEDKEKEAAKKQKQLDGLTEKTKVAKKEAAEFGAIDGLAKKTIGGNYQLTPANWEKVSNLAKEGVKSRGIIAGLKKQIEGFVNKIKELTAKLTKYEGKKESIMEQVNYHQANIRAPRRMAETIADIMRQPPEQQRQHTPQQERKRNNNIDIGG